MLVSAILFVVCPIGSAVAFNVRVTVIAIAPVDTIGPTVPYLMDAVFAALSFVLAITKIPQTLGIELEDLDDARVTTSRSPFGRPQL